VDFPPRFTGESGKVQGLIVGVGGQLPLPIPKLDETGDQVGVWGRDEVMQVDVYSLGRAGDVPGETMVGVETGDLARRLASGTEHLSSLHEEYLGQLAAGLGLDYQRLEAPGVVAEVLTTGRYAFRRAAVHDVHGWLGAVALTFIVLIYLIYSAGGRKARRRWDAA
jgi:mxaL protein